MLGSYVVGFEFIMIPHMQNFFVDVGCCWILAAVVQTLGGTIVVSLYRSSFVAKLVVLDITLLFTAVLLARPVMMMSNILTLF